MYCRLNLATASAQMLHIVNSGSIAIPSGRQAACAFVQFAYHVICQPLFMNRRSAMLL